MEEKIKVMVVDDSLPFRSILSSILSQHPNIEVVATAYSGKMALHRLKTEQKLPDVIILDYEMPELDGFQTLKILKEEYPLISVIMLSSYAEENSHFSQKAKNLYADEVMYKPSSGKSREENIEKIKNELINKIFRCYENSKLFKKEKNKEE